jgi:hypothetical protein
MLLDAENTRVIQTVDFLVVTSLYNVKIHKTTSYSFTAVKTSNHTEWQQQQWPFILFILVRRTFKQCGEITSDK